MRKWNIKIASIIVVLVVATVATMGQNRNPVLRMVRGTVMDKQGRATRFQCGVLTRSKDSGGENTDCR